MSVISALGSTSRALKNRFLDGGVSVLDFSSTAGRGNDDSAAINAALQASCSYTQTNPAAKTCKVIFPEPPSGAYNVCANPVTLPGYWSSVMLQGTGAAPKIRVMPGCTSGIQAVVYQSLNTGDSSAARLHIDNLTLDSYCIAPYNLYLGYAVGTQVTKTIFRNVKGGTGNTNVYVGGGYEINIEKSNRAENVNEPGHTCYSSQADLPDYNLVTNSSDSWYGLAAVDAKIANYYQANGGNNHFADAHGWGFISAFAPYASGNLAPQYTFLIVGNADINGAVLDSPQVAGVYLKGGNDTNGNPTSSSGALVSGTFMFGSPANTPAVLLDTGLINATIVGNGWGNQTSAVSTVSGGISPTIVIANNGDASPVASAVVASPVKGGDTAQLTAYGAGSGIGLNAQSASANSGVYINAKGAAAVQLGSNSATAFSAYANPNSVNFIGTTANSAGYSPVLQAVGSDANISLNLSGKGNGTVALSSPLQLSSPGSTGDISGMSVSLAGRPAPSTLANTLSLSAQVEQFRLLADGSDWGPGLRRAQQFLASTGGTLRISTPGPLTIATQVSIPKGNPYLKLACDSQASVFTNASSLTSPMFSVGGSTAAGGVNFDVDGCGFGGANTSSSYAFQLNNANGMTIKNSSFLNMTTAFNASASYAVSLDNVVFNGVTTPFYSSTSAHNFVARRVKTYGGGTVFRFDGATDNASVVEGDFEGSGPTLQMAGGTALRYVGNYTEYFTGDPIYAAAAIYGADVSNNWIALGAGSSSTWSLKNFIGGQFKGNSIYNQTITTGAGTVDLELGDNQVTGSGSIASTPYASPSFTNGWYQQSGYSSVGYRLSRSGQVVLRGNMLNAGSNLNTAAFTLPAKYRPSTYRNFATANSSNTASFVQVTPDGKVTVVNTQAGAGTSGNPYQASLDGIAFEPGS